MDSSIEREELELLLDISKIFNKHVELRTAFGPVLRILETRAGLHNGMVTLLDRSSGMLRIEEASGLAEGSTMRGFYRLGEDNIGQVFETGIPVTVPDSSGLTFYCVPICSGPADGVPGGVVIGTLSAERRTMDEKSEFSLARSGHKHTARFLEKVSSLIADSLRLRERIAEEQGGRESGPVVPEPGAALEASLSRLEKELIEEALRLSGGNMAAASRRLGITERQMGLRVRHYSINWKIYRN